MSILWQDGFDSYATSTDLALEYVVAGPTLNISGGRFGAGAIQITSHNGWSLLKGLTAISEIWIGCAVNITSDGSSGPLFSFVNSSGGTEGTVAVNTLTGVITGSKGLVGVGGTALGSSGGGAISMGSWHWVEAHYKIHATAGIIEVWVDGVQVLNLTGQNTSYSGGSTISLAGLGNLLGAYGLTASYDDIYILDPNTSPNTSRLGDSRIETVVPTSDAGPNNGTPLSGSTHYGAVNEAQYDTSNYLTMTNTSGQEEMFGMAPLGGAPVNVWAVRVIAIAEKTDAGASSLQTVVKSSGTEGDGPSTLLQTAWAPVSGIYEQDPHTSAQWAYAAVNAATYGVKVP